MGNLLVVDDNQQNLYMLQILLSTNGYHVELAGNGAEALEKARKSPPDVIVSDILMPVMDGYSLCREWKEDELLKHIPFVFYTATYTNSKDEEFAYSLGADKFIIKPVEPEQFLAILREILQENITARSAPILEEKEGSEYYKEYNTRLIHKLEDKMQQLEETNRALKRDIAARKKAEEERNRLEDQLYQAQKMESVGRLAGGVAHDFNNILQVILGNAEIAMHEADSSHPIFNNLKEIQKAALHSAELTHQLLAFARKQNIEPRVLNMNETVSGMLKMLKRLIGEDIELTWQPTDESLLIHMDPTQVNQILANLCVNARDAISGIGEIHITVSLKSVDDEFCAKHSGCKPGDYVQLTVRDTGAGMDEETQTHLFEPFFTTKEPGKGTGLGLATVYGIVKQNCGLIECDSEFGIGTAFYIYLPRHIGEDDKLPLESLAKSISLNDKTILIVEDDKANLEVAISMLDHTGCTLLAANSPSEAIRIVCDYGSKIDLLITDVIMPEMNGRDLINSLMPLNPELKYMYMSGYTADLIANQCVLEEGVHVIHKPFSIKELIKKIGEVLEPQ